MDEAVNGPDGVEEPIDAARRLLAEAERVSRELGALADDIVAQAENGRQEARRLIAALSEAAATLSGEPVALVQPPVAHIGSDGARMLARQMLANGSARSEVEERLRDGFRVKDAAAVVDSVATGAG